MTLELFLVLGLALFSIGLFAVLSRQHLIGILIGIELMLAAASVNFIAFNYFVVSDAIVGQVVVLFVIGLAAAEVAIALSIVLAVHRARRTVDVGDLSRLKG